MSQAKELDPSSSPKAFFGAELRRLREAAGLSQDRLGALVYCSGTYIGQIEAAARKPQPDLAQRLDEALRTDGYFGRLCEMVSRSPHPEYFAAVADLEAGALTISQFAGGLVPGLLQTADYADALIRAAHPLAPQREVDERVRARLDRARLLENETSPLLWVILHEVALRVSVGGTTVAHAQLRHVAQLARRHRILVQVLECAAGAHAANTGSFRLMTFADAPPVVYEEGQHTGQLLDEPALVEKYARSYDLARAAALSPEASLTLIESATED